MQMLLQLNGYINNCTMAHIEALDAFCSSRHNALSMTLTAARTHLPGTHQQATMQSL